jgi:hypothetical protein
LYCGEEGLVKALTKFSSDILSRLHMVGTHRNLTFLLIKFIRGHGYLTMQDICNQHNLPQEYNTFAISQDKIGWRQFLEEMISRKLYLLLCNIGL